MIHIEFIRKLIFHILVNSNDFVGYIYEPHLIRNSQCLYARNHSECCLERQSSEHNFQYLLANKRSKTRNQNHNCIIKGNDYLIAIYSRTLMPTGREIWTCVFAKKNENWTLFQHKNNKVKNSRKAYNHFLD